jgi:RHS repeat-associated protein
MSSSSTSSSSSVQVPKKECPKDGEGGEGGESPDFSGEDTGGGESGGGTGGSGGGGVNTSDGQPVVGAKPVGFSQGLNIPFSTAVSYRPQSGGSGSMGSWASSSLAGLEILNGGAKIIYRTTPDSALLFIETTPGTYQAEYFVRDILTKSGSTYTLTRTDGSKRTFDSAGLLTGFSSAGGQNAVVSYSGGSGQVSSVKATIDTNNWWEYLYTWSSGRVTDIIYQVKVEGVESQVLKTSYSYVNVGGTHLLETIKVREYISDWGDPISSECFRYDSSKRLVYQKVYPTGSGSTSDHVSYKYNRQQEVTSKKDELGIIHGYSYDKLGRPIVDEVSAIPSGVDSHVNRIETGWNTRGLRSRTTSKSGPSTVRNEVKWDYNDFNQPVTEFQQHGGAVTTGSMKVTYGYEDGTGNTTRRKSMKYPHTGTGAAPVLNLNYVTQQANALSRFDQLKLDTTTVGTFKYLGMGTLVEQQNPKATLSYGNAANNYNGFDRFGRPVATLWNKTSGGSVLVQSAYGRNRVGGIVWRRDVQAQSMSIKTQDNHYWYDGLQQVKRHDRGDLTPTSGPPYSGITPATRQQQENFTFDQTGNWLGYNSQDPLLAQTRTHNEDNEILTITNPAGVTQPQHDALGNMTTMPDPANWATARTCVWDAWNRLVEVKDGGVSVAKFRYDGLTRRITKETPAQTRSYYFNNQWRALEERISGTVNKDYLWNPADRWNLIRYRYTPSGNGPPTQTRYVLKDGLDPVAIIDDTGTVKERARYKAFGPVTFMNASFGSPSSTSSEEWNFLFHGEILDGETGLYNYGYRQYHPELGRWLSRDPLGDKRFFDDYVRKTFVTLNDLERRASWKKLKEESEKNPYNFLDNSSVNDTDEVGLIKYQTVTCHIVTRLPFNYCIFNCSCPGGYFPILSARTACCDSDQEQTCFQPEPFDLVIVGVVVIALIEPTPFGEAAAAGIIAGAQ